MQLLDSSKKIKEYTLNSQLLMNLVHELRTFQESYNVCGVKNPTFSHSNISMTSSTYIQFTTINENMYLIMSAILWVHLTITH